MRLGNFRFYRRIRIFPGLSVNLAKSGPSLSVGVRGAHVTFGGKGIQRTIGIPGSGVYYTSRSGYHSGFHSAHVEAPLDPARQRAAHRIGAVVTLGLIALVVVLVLELLAAIS